MARKHYAPASEQQIELNVTAMIDVVFNLIIFFMVIVEYAHLDVRTGIQLPRASQAEVKDNRPPDRIIVNVEWVGEGKRPSVWFRNQQVDMANLSKLLHQAAILKRTKDKAAENEPSDQAILLRADTRTEWQYIQEIILECAKEKIWQLSVVAKPSDATVREKIMRGMK
jgi:biopolymer transport protein ExbD